MVLSQLFFSIVWILSWIELQNIVEVQIWQILADAGWQNNFTTFWFVLISLFVILVPSKVSVESGGCEFCAHKHLSHGQWLTTWIQGLIIHVTLTNVPFFDPSPKFAIRSKAVHSWRVTPRVNQWTQYLER